jgi:hypothetical protein
MAGLTGEWAMRTPGGETENRCENCDGQHQVNEWELLKFVPHLEPVRVGNLIELGRWLCAHCRGGRAITLETKGPAV